jgi:hypothetical protein
MLAKALGPASVTVIKLETIKSASKKELTCDIDDEV